MFGTIFFALATFNTYKAIIGMITVEYFAILYAGFNSIGIIKKITGRNRIVWVIEVRPEKEPMRRQKN